MTAVPQAEPGIDQKSLFAKLEWKPHSDAQRDYAYSNTRFNIPCCGRRWGKSQAAGHRMTYKSFVPESYNWIVGPTYKLGEKEFRVVYQDYQKLNLLKYCKKSYNVKQGDMRILTPWNSVIEVVSADNQDSLLGEGLSHAIMSEAARHSQQTWDQYIEPALSDLLGTCDFPSTPKGFNWYHGLWMLGQSDTPSSAMYKSWRFPSWTNSVRYPGGEKNGEIIRIRAVVSRNWFEQEYGANFTTISGAIYDEWDARVHIQPWTYNPALANYLAFDYGFANPFVCLDMQVEGESCHVWREYYTSYLSTQEHGQHIASRTNPNGYSVQGMWGDPRGADEAATLSLLLGFVASQDVPWKHGIEQIKRMLKNNQLTIDPSCTNLIRQMSQLHVKPPARNSALDLNERMTDGNIQHKVDDHACDALRYFIGPYFVLGVGIHLKDVYGEDYIDSEGAHFLQDHMGTTTSVVLNEELSLNRPL